MNKNANDAGQKASGAAKAPKWEASLAQLKKLLGSKSESFGRRLAISLEMLDAALEALNALGILEELQILVSGFQYTEKGDARISYTLKQVFTDSWNEEDDDDENEDEGEKWEISKVETYSNSL